MILNVFLKSFFKGTYEETSWNLSDILKMF